MRTSIEIDDNLFNEVKKFSLDSKKSLGLIIEDALRVMMLKKDRDDNFKPKISLITCGKKGLHHGGDLDNNQSLLDIMDN